MVNNKQVPVVDQIFWAGYSGVTYLPATRRADRPDGGRPAGRRADRRPAVWRLHLHRSSPSCWSRNIAASCHRPPTSKSSRHVRIDLKDHIRSIPDFPKPGILFYDISTLLAHPKAWHETIEQLADAIRPHKPDVLAGIELRGFLLAAPLALALGTGFVMLRKQGKLPGITVRHTYALEYGTDTIEIQADAIERASAWSGRRPAGDRRHHGRGDHPAANGRRGRAGGRLHHRAHLPRRPQRLSVPVEALLQYDS